MTVLPLVTAPDPRLAVPSAEVDKVDDALRVFMDDMLETMYDNEGIGLAAVQVGVHKRVLVMDLHQEGKPSPLYMVNPVITAQSDEKNTYKEGCLSFPGQAADVVRPKQVTVSYLDYHGEPQTLECDDLLATCVQHEIDHLNGVTFVDHLSRLKRETVMRKVRKLRKRSGE